MAEIDFTTARTQKLFRNILENIPAELRDDYVALDCEMVGTEKYSIHFYNFGFNLSLSTSLLARATVFNGHGELILGKN